MRHASLAFGVLLLTTVTTPTLAQDGGSVGVGATVTITTGALGESVGGRHQFVRGIAGSLNAIADRSRSPLERRADEESRAWVASLASRLSAHLELRQAALDTPGRTLAQIRADLDRLDRELAVLAADALTEAGALDSALASSVTELLRPLL